MKEITIACKNTGLVCHNQYFEHSGKLARQIFYHDALRLGVIVHLIEGIKPYSLMFNGEYKGDFKHYPNCVAKLFKLGGIEL